MKLYLLLVLLIIPLVVISSYGQTTPSHTPLDVIEIQSDKSMYHLDDIITINGIMHITGESIDTKKITYQIHHNDEVIQSGNVGTLNKDGTFNFIIPIESWDFTDTVILRVLVESFTSSDYSFHYSNTSNITIELLHQIIMDHGNMINSLKNDILQQNNTITKQNEIIKSQQLIINHLTHFHDIDAPIQILDFSVISNGDNSVTLSWDIISDDPITHYKFKYKSNSDNWIKEFSNDGTITFFTIHDLKSVKYDFRVIAFTDSHQVTSNTIILKP